MSSSATLVSSVVTMHPNDHWISSRSVAIIETRKTLSASDYYFSTRWSLRHRIVMSPTDDRERCWAEKALNLENAVKMWITAHSDNSTDRLVGESLVSSKQLWECMVLLFTQINVELNNRGSTLMNSSVNHLPPNYYKCHHIQLRQDEISHFTLFIQFCDW